MILVLVVAAFGDILLCGSCVCVYVRACTAYVIETSCPFHFIKCSDRHFFGGGGGHMFDAPARFMCAWHAVFSCTPALHVLGTLVARWGVGRGDRGFVTLNVVHV